MDMNRGAADILGGGRVQLSGVLMGQIDIEYAPQGRQGFVCSLVAPKGSSIQLSGALDVAEPNVSGSAALTSNLAVVSNLWAYGLHEADYRRFRSPEKRRSHE